MSPLPPLNTCTTLVITFCLTPFLTHRGQQKHFNVFTEKQDAWLSPEILTVHLKIFAYCKTSARKIYLYKSGRKAFW